MSPRINRFAAHYAPAKHCGSATEGDKYSNLCDWTSLLAAPPCFL
jgi:hypothetical protein